jgi:hypothetical protein
MNAPVSFFSGSEFALELLGLSGDSAPGNVGAPAKPQQPPRFEANDLYGPGGNPRAADIDQDSIGDCYFVATIGALAEKQPDRIKNAIDYDPATGNYTVKLHKEEWQWAPPGWETREVKIEVTQKDLENNLTRHGGSTVDNNSGTDGPMWPAVMETAYARMHDENHSDGLNQGYEEINGGWAKDAMFAVTGSEGKDIGPIGMLPGDAQSKILYEQISGALKDGRAVTLSTDPENRDLIDIVSGDPGVQDGLVDNHVYMVEGITKDANGKVMIELRNPWSHNINPDEGQNNGSATIKVELSKLIETGGLDDLNVGPGK